MLETSQTNLFIWKKQQETFLLESRILEIQENCSPQTTYQIAQLKATIQPIQNQNEKWVILLKQFNSLKEAESLLSELEAKMRDNPQQFRLPLEDQPLRIYKQTQHYSVVFEGFLNKTKPEIFLGEIQEKISDKAEVIDILKDCGEWIFDCETGCFYSCGS